MIPLLAANPLIEAWHWLLDLIASGLSMLHGVFEPIAGIHAWGWAIIGLTVVIRVLLLPLAIKQTRSMREMQALQPELAKLKQKYKTDRDLMKRDPDKYKRNKQKQQEEMMTLYRERGVNPAASCLPLLLQAPIFFALFRVLQNADTDIGAQLGSAPFYVFDQLSTATNAAGVWGWGLVVLMAGSMFWSQRQMMARRADSDGDDTQTQQQKIMMYVMPVFLGFVAQGLPIGVLLYWVTTNFWQMGQQAIIIHEIQAHPDEGGGKGGGGKGGGSPKSGPGGNGQARKKTSKKGSNQKGSKANGGPSKKPQKPKQREDHLPRRRSRGG